jgi:hypothetical protein
MLMQRRNFRMPPLEVEANQIAHDIVAMSESLLGDSEEVDVTSISLLELSAAFSAVAFVARRLVIDGQTESESMIRKELSYDELLSVYEEVRSLCEKSRWAEVNALCQREGARIAGLAPNLLA